MSSFFCPYPARGHVQSSHWQYFPLTKYEKRVPRNIRRSWDLKDILNIQKSYIFTRNFLRSDSKNKNKKKIIRSCCRQNKIFRHLKTTFY
jgi:hypothetical protein